MGQPLGGVVSAGSGAGLGHTARTRSAAPVPVGTDLVGPKGAGVAGKVVCHGALFPAWHRTPTVDFCSRQHLVAQFRTAEQLSWRASIACSGPPSGDPSQQVQAGHGLQPGKLPLQALARRLWPDEAAVFQGNHDVTEFKRLTRLHLGRLLGGRGRIKSASWCGKGQHIGGAFPPAANWH